jgi:hypothetical protein
MKPLILEALDIGHSEVVLVVELVEASGAVVELVEVTTLSALGHAPAGTDHACHFPGQSPGHGNWPLHVARPQLLTPWGWGRFRNPRRRRRSAPQYALGLGVPTGWFGRQGKVWADRFEFRACGKRPATGFAPRHRGRRSSDEARRGPTVSALQDSVHGGRSAPAPQVSRGCRWGPKQDTLRFLRESAAETIEIKWQQRPALGRGEGDAM